LEKEVPDAPQKKDSLVTARLACESALKDVDALLDKYPTLGGKANRSIIERLGFISNDIDGLKSRLESSGNNLQKCLTSLTSVSVLQLQHTMNELLAEYKSGKRDEKKSVLAAAVKKNQRPDDDEAMEQMEKDLLDEKIHPDCIDMHKAAIRAKVTEWLSETVSESSFTEKGTLYYTAVEYLQAGPSTQRSMPIDHYSDQRQSTTGIVSRQAADQDLYSVSPPRRGAWSGSTPGTTNSNSGTTTLPNRFQRNETGAYDRLAPASEAPSSRRSSSASHTSHASNWHPNREPDPDYVSKMLAKPLSVDPIKDSMDIEKANLWFKRAFHGQDYRDKGYLTRNEVNKMCQEALSNVDVVPDAQYLMDLISLGDEDHDGRIVQDEFLVIIHNVWEHISDLASQQMLARFESDIKSAIAAAEARRDADVVGSLPWGFARERVPPFYDEIEEAPVDFQPSLLPLHSFTLMAKEIASRSVRVIDDANEYWTKALSQDLQKKFNETLDKVRDMAIKFTKFYDTNSEAALSDLDEMLAALTVIQETRPQYRELSQILQQLRSVQRRSFHLARHICGFVWRLEHPDADAVHEPNRPSWPSTRTLTADLGKWRNARMETWAWLISDEPSRISEELTSGWDAIDDTIFRCRQWYAQSNDVMYKPVSSSSMSMASSHYSLIPTQNTLNSQAVEIVRMTAATLRQHDTDERGKLREKSRTCTLSRLRIERTNKRSFFAKGEYLYRFGNRLL
jgi:hypothetical protein